MRPSPASAKFVRQRRGDAVGYLEHRQGNSIWFMLPITKVTAMGSPKARPRTQHDAAHHTRLGVGRTHLQDHYFPKWSTPDRQAIPSAWWRDFKHVTHHRGGDEGMIMIARMMPADKCRCHRWAERKTRPGKGTPSVKVCSGCCVESTDPDRTPAGPYMPYTMKAPQPAVPPQYPGALQPGWRQLSQEHGKCRSSRARQSAKR